MGNNQCCNDPGLGGFAGSAQSGEGRKSMNDIGRRIVTGHDANGKSVILSDGVPPQNNPMRGNGADFIEIWSSAEAVPTLAAQPDSEPALRDFTMMPATGHLIRIIDISPASEGGSATPMHRTETLDYAVVIEGEITLILDDSEVTLGPGAVSVQRGTDHAWENRTDKRTRMAFFHIAAQFSPALRATLPDDLPLMR
jgi:mannose-6-phosphate isomerase-like protein (cupin superfamily)